MKTFAAILALLCLMVSAGCTTVKPTVIVKTEVVKDRVPGALLKPCPKEYSKEIQVTGDFVARGDTNAAGLKTCSAQVDSIRKWDAQ